MTDAAGTNGFDAWHPGLGSAIPPALMPLVTLFRPENAFLTHAEAKDIAAFTGLPLADLVSLRPRRLVVHELLVQVTANLSVPDGPDYEILGINLRAMAATILDKHIAPRMGEIEAAFETVRRDARQLIARDLSQQIFDQRERRDAAAARSWWMRRFSNPAAHKPGSAQDTPVELRALAHWKERAPQEASLRRACLDALINVVGGIFAHRGRLIADKDLLENLATAQVCNIYGSRVIGHAIEPMVRAAAADENYRLLPAQNKPVIINVKGASASGKSTIRPQQRQLAERLGVPWADFALISPDYWRKFLLDYASLGAHHKYGAMLNGQELELIDRKLDRYMAEKAARRAMSHLLIDRFRFDSFATDKGGNSDSKLLSRFGERVFMFFMVTPPAETVARAWQRGLKTGRYKAVDDLLYHNVEAYRGMPELFFSWIEAARQHVHYEFLDNDVAQGTLPKTAAFGWNGSMVVLDVKVLIDIERFRKVNVAACDAGTVFDPADLPVEKNCGFLKRCVEKIADVRFADQATAAVYAQFKNGELVWCDHAYLARQAHAPALAAAIAMLGCAEGVAQGNPDPIDVAREKSVTVGRWAQG